MLLSVLAFDITYSIATTWLSDLPQEQKDYIYGQITGDVLLVGLSMGVGYGVSRVFGPKPVGPSRQNARSQTTIQSGQGAQGEGQPGSGKPGGGKPTETPGGEPSTNKSPTAEPEVKTNCPIKGVPKTEYGFTKSWSEMTFAERNAFKHSYMRHQKDFNLLNWSETNAEALRISFNKAVSNVKENAQTSYISKEFVGERGSGTSGALTDVRYFEYKSPSGATYYYYETIDGKFVSSGIKTR